MADIDWRQVGITLLLKHVGIVLSLISAAYVAMTQGIRRVLFYLQSLASCWCSCICFNHGELFLSLGFRLDKYLLASILSFCSYYTVLKLCLLLYVYGKGIIFRLRNGSST